MIAVIAVGAAGCLTGEQHTVERTLTSTVTLSRESLVFVNLPIPVVIEGSNRTDDVVIEVDLTVTASSSTVADLKADEVKIETKSENDALLVAITEPPRVTLGGRCSILMPADVDLKVLGRGGTVDVVSMEGQIEIDAITHVRVVGVQDNMDVAIENGNALIESEAPPGKLLVVNLNRGDIDLTLPAAVSANIEADVIGSGNIVIAHPMLPRYPGGTLPYRADVSGGLSVIRLQTGTGLIVIK
jgi:hypothetical protein